ncbi:hypothetical protein LXL04_035833 [Taraxacum kok-saghyz]
MQKLKKKYRFFGNFFQRIVMIKNVLEGSEVFFFFKGITLFNVQSYTISSCWYMMVETEPVVDDLVTHITEDVETNNFMEPTYECDKDEGTNESMLGKVFDTPDDAYNYYNDYSFLHGFGIRKDDTIKNPKTKEDVCNKEGFKQLEKNY